MNIIAQWTDSSGYYRVERDGDVLATYYAPDDTDPAIQHLTPTVLAPTAVEFEWVGDFGYGGDFMGLDFVCIAGTVYEVTA